MTLTSLPCLVADPETNLDEEVRSRIVDFLFGNRVFDLDGKFRAEGNSYKLASIHVHAAPVASFPEAHARLTTDTKQELFVYLKSEGGAVFPFKSCESLLADLHTAGILFKGPDGDAWFAETGFDGHGVILGDDPTAYPVDEVPLRKIHAQSIFCMGQNGTIDEILADGPSDGEFVITEEINARLVFIPWLSAYGKRNDQPYQPEIEILDKLKARIALMAGSPVNGSLSWVAGSAQDIAGGRFSHGPSPDLDGLTRKTKDGDIIAGRNASGDVVETWFKLNMDLVRLPEGINGATHETMIKMVEDQSHMRLATRANVAFRLVGYIDGLADKEDAQDFRKDVMRFLQGIGGPVLEGQLDDEAITMVRTGRSINGHPQVLVDIRHAEPKYEPDMEP